MKAPKSFICSLSLLTVAFTLSASTSFAVGGANGGGGNAVICEGQPAVILDYYDAALPNMSGVKPELVDIQNLSTEQTVEMLTKQLRGFIQFRIQVEDALQAIGPIESHWKPANLRAADDSLEPYFLPDGCVRKTAAYRQNPNMMYGDPTVLKLLSPSQKGVLLMHEAFYKVANDTHGATNSVDVRNLIGEILKKKPNPKVLSERINAVGTIGQDESLGKLSPSKRDVKFFSYTRYGGLSNEFTAQFEVSEDRHLKIFTSGWSDLPQVLELDCSDEALIRTQRLNQQPLDPRKTRYACEIIRVEGQGFGSHEPTFFLDLLANGKYSWLYSGGMHSTYIRPE